MNTPRKSKVSGGRFIRHDSDALKKVTLAERLPLTEEPTPDVTESVDDDMLSTIEPTPSPTVQSKKPKWYTFAWFKKMPLKKKLLVVIPTVLVLLGSGVGAWALTRKKPAPVEVKAPAPVVEKIVEPPKPTTEASKLTGVQITPELNQRGITGIMIENSIDARPQSGLLDAGIVFEAIAEGGITRFLALYQEAQPDYIGPVRSARPYYISWLKPFGATYAHVGGSPEGLQMIIDQHIRDMNEFVNAAAYQRISSRFAPHNAYTAMAKLDAVRAAKNYDSPAFTSFLRKDASVSKTITASSINLNLSSLYFNVHYDYDQATNTYKRSEGGKPHVDDRSGKQLSPNVVIAMIVPYSIHPDGIHSVYATVGSGKVYIFEDGTVTEGTWTKNSIDDQLSFADASGTKIGLNPGQTWITALGQASMVTYTAPAPAAAAAP